MMDAKEIKRYMLRWADENRDAFYELADGIWTHPELSMQEHRAADLLCGALEGFGFRVERGVGGMPTAFIAGAGNGRPVIGVNCEYDALPGLSQAADRTERVPIVEGGPGHGCGHNILGVGGLKAAVALRRVMEAYGLSGTIKLIGAPAEELCLGKPFLGKAGLLSGFDAILDWHPWYSNDAGCFSCPAYFSVKFHYRGKTAHGNAPWYGRSALDAAMLQAHATEFLREHLDPGKPPYAANTFNYTFPDTGTEFPSVVPDRATVWYIGRFVTTDDAEEALRRITLCAEGAAISTETSVEREIVTATNHRVPNRVLADLMYANFSALGAPVFTEDERETVKALQRATGVPETGLASEILPMSEGFAAVSDISEFSRNAPFVTATVAAGPDNVGWHHWTITRCVAGSIGRKAMDRAAELMAATGVDLLCDPSLIERAKEEFDERLGGKGYRCLLPEDAEPPVDLNADLMAKYGS
ncbi:MAG: amidohydrolase [Clostridiales Family XIII bacterium]|nr:amidohydrolase [Clostridiales Family XIII bacterium]